MKILLGSNSPRRKELLQNLGFDFEVVSINCDEIFPENLEVEKIASFCLNLKQMPLEKLKKTKFYSQLIPVTFENKVLGKPKNREEAVEMLLIYLENTSSLYRNFFKTSEKIITKTDVADVEFQKFLTKK
jgi:septum formation protein